MAAKIINVTKTETTYTVTYESGTVRTASIEKMPGTVKAWLEANTQDPEPVSEPEQEPISEPESEKIDLDDDSQTAYIDLYATWHEPEPEYRAVEIVLDDLVKDPEYHDTPIPPRKELPAASQRNLPRLTPDPKPTRRGPSAAEAVMFGLCIGFAVAWWGIVGIVQILAAGIEVLWGLVKPRVLAGCRMVAVRAKALAASLPEVTTRRGLAVAVRVVPVLIGLIALA